VTDPEQQARQAFERGVRASNAGRPAVGARLLRAGLATLGWREDAWQAGAWRAGARADTPEGARPVQGGPVRYRALAARLVISLALMEAEQGRTDYGLRLLAEAEAAVDQSDLGALFSQRGVVLLRAGRWAAALEQLIAAESMLRDDPEWLSRVLLNRSVLYLNIGDVRHARSDLTRSVAIAEAAGLVLLAAKATQNLGCCDLLNGDIPAALHQFDVAARAYQTVAPGILPGLEMDRARALLAAGLAEEATAALEVSIAAFRRQRRDQLLAESELARAQAAQMAGDLAAARHWAGLAMRRFRARGNDAWAALAELTRLRASFVSVYGGVAQAARPTARPSAAIAAQARRVADKLRAYRLPRDAALAELIAAHAFTAAGRPEQAARCLAAAEARGLPLEAVLLRRLARAELTAADGRTGAALAELRTGLAAVHTRRGQLGSLELQTGTAALGAELAAVGLRLVLATGSARQIFTWTERSRAQSFRLHPVRPPADTEAAAALAELRQLAFLIRTAELSGAPQDPAHLTRRTELQRSLRQHSWQTAAASRPRAPAQRGAPAETGVADHPEVKGEPARAAEALAARQPEPSADTRIASAAAVAAALAASGQVLASFAVQDGRMLAVTIVDGRFALTPLGDFAIVAEAARRLTADLDVLAGRRLPPRLAAVINDSIRHHLAELDALLLTPLRLPLDPGAAGDGGVGVVLIPVGVLSAVPWGMLPSLRGRPVAVCPSATTWLASWHAARGDAADDSGRPGVSPLLVAGPGLDHAVTEVTEIAAIYPGAAPLTGDAATVDATLRALDGASLAHLAAHGHHDRENILFSRLDLADGPLMAYDIQRLAVPPRQMILSACDVGRAVVRPGEEILGFTAALLHAGTPAVISSVTRIDDETACALMTAYHRSLSAGARPALALAQAAASATPDEAPLTPFVCFGAG
jgi:CHAT domain